VELSSVQRRLIEKIIKSNPKFIGNEDLLEEFVAETYKRSYLLLDSINNTANLENYLDKVVSNSIQSVLKAQGRAKRVKEGFSRKVEPPVEPEKISPPPVPIQAQTEEPMSELEQLANESYKNIKDPIDKVETSIAEKAVIQKITNIIYELNLKYPSKEFFKIYYYRYVRGYKQSKIAQEMKLSQGGVSKRMVEMVKLVKERLR